MQNFSGLRILVLSAGLALAAGAPAAQAAASQTFDLGYGWDAGFAYAQPDALRSVAMSEAVRGDAAGGFDLPMATSPAERAAPRSGLAQAMAIPVPGSLVLFGSGLLMLAVVSRRRAPRRAA